MNRLLIVLAACLPLTALAAEPGSSVAPVAAGLSGGSGGQLLQLLFGLLLVVGLIFGLAWAARRMQNLGPRRSGNAIRLISALPLSARDRLVLVQVGQEQVLLGLTAGRITPLHTLKEPIPVNDAEPASPEFAQRLMELLNRKDRS